MECGEVDASASTLRVFSCSFEDAETFGRRRPKVLRTPIRPQRAIAVPMRENRAGALGHARARILAGFADDRDFRGTINGIKIRGDPTRRPVGPVDDVAGSHEVVFPMSFDRISQSSTLLEHPS
jgi:hypothetical protein